MYISLKSLSIYNKRRSHLLHTSFKMLSQLPQLLYIHYTARVLKQSVVHPQVFLHG